jgi:hypothetical protein
MKKVMPSGKNKLLNRNLRWALNKYINSSHFSLQLFLFASIPHAYVGRGAPSGHAKMQIFPREE